MVGLQRVANHLVEEDAAEAWRKDHGHCAGRGMLAAGSLDSALERLDEPTMRELRGSVDSSRALDRAAAPVAAGDGHGSTEDCPMAPSGGCPRDGADHGLQGQRTEDRATETCPSLVGQCGGCLAPCGDIDGHHTPVVAFFAYGDGRDGYADAGARRAEPPGTHVARPDGARLRPSYATEMNAARVGDRSTRFTSLAQGHHDALPLLPKDLDDSKATAERPKQDRRGFLKAWQQHGRSLGNRKVLRSRCDSACTAGPEHVISHDLLPGGSGALPRRASTELSISVTFDSRRIPSPARDPDRGRSSVQCAP